MKIASTLVLTDDGVVIDVVSLLRHLRCRQRHLPQASPNETLVWVFPGRTMTTSSMSFSLPGNRFGAGADWKGIEADLGFIPRIKDEGSRQRGAVESRRPMRVDGLAQEDGAVWRRGGIDDRPSMVVALVHVQKMDRWKMAVTDEAMYLG